MKSTLKIFVVILILQHSVVNAQTYFWIATSSSNWSDGTKWSLTSGGPACSCTPSTTATVQFNGGPDGTRDGDCILDVSTTINIATFTNDYDGTFDANGNDLTLAGNSTFNNASIIDGPGTSDLIFQTGFTFTNNSSISVHRISLPNGNTASINQSTITVDNFELSVSSGGASIGFTITNASVVNAATLSIQAFNLFLNGGTFNGTSHTFIKTAGGLAANNSTGGNTFNAANTSITTMSTSSNLYLATVNGDDFNGNVHFGCSQSGSSVAVAYNAVSTFSGNITTSSSIQTANSDDGVTFGYNTGGAILDGPSDQTFRVTNGTYTSTSNIKGTQFGNLTIQKPSGVVILDAASSAANARPMITVTRNLNLQSGIIDTGSTANLFVFNDNATVSNANNASYVNGRVYKTGDDDFTFPIGANNFYRPAGISGITPGATASQFFAQYFDADPLNTGSFETTLSVVSNKEYWFIDRSSGSESPRITLSWNENLIGSTSYVTDEATMHVAAYNVNTWEDLGRSSSTGNATIGAVTSGETAFFTDRRFTLGSSSASNSLPVELLYFKAELVDDGVLLTWKTLGELNNDFFIVESSQDGIQFVKVGTVQGKGTTQVPQQYSLKDNESHNKKRYYRLRQIDFDGKEKVLSIFFLKEKNTAVEFQIWPVPTSSYLYLSKRCNITIANTQGHVLMKELNVDVINVSGLDPGIYLITDNVTRWIKFMVK